MNWTVVLNAQAVASPKLFLGDADSDPLAQFGLFGLLTTLSVHFP
jgi:hypothetical protein